MINAILCPLRNAAHLTRKAHKTFVAQDIEPEVEILYIDNGSTDNTSQMLAGWDCHVIRNATPKGVSASWNQGLEWWFRMGAEYVLVVNNDVELLPETYRLLLADGGGFVTGVSQGEKDKYMAAGTTAPRPHPDFSCFLIRKEVWDKVGRFDESMAIYCQDGDYHLRMHKAGINAYCIDLPFYHERSSTLKLADPKEAKAILKQAELDRTAFHKKWGVDMWNEAYHNMFRRDAPSSTL